MIALTLIAGNDTQARSINGGSAGGAVSAPNLASDAATQAAQQAAAAARQTQDSLARAARAVQNIQAVQAAARAAAAAQQTSVTVPVVVPNGLGAGGLLPNMPAGWTGAYEPTQSVDGTGQSQVNVRQTTPQAILNWQSFNVGARTTLTFDQQGNSNWVALNRVDRNAGPSQILGQIKADGQVYVINQSGIIFGGNSQINVGSLIASSANITESQFLTNGIYSTQSGSGYAASFTGAGGKITVEAGALIAARAPAQVTSGGGFIALLGSSVTNEGTIQTPRGQALLAAGDDFILRPGYGTDVNTYSTTRGTEVAPVIAAGSPNGAVTNSGLIFAQQGDVTLAGRTLMQSGTLISTTSVNTRGTIHLLNSASDSAGGVTLAAGSLTVVLPELGSSETALNGQRDGLIAASVTQDAARSLAVFGQFDNLSTLSDRRDQSRIEIVSGGFVTFKNGSSTAAQGGQIAVSSGKRIFAEDGAALDVSGVRNVALAMASNNIKVNVQGNELRDSPQNRDSGVLKNNDVWIDARDLIFVPAGTGGYASDRYYTAGGLLEVGGYLGTSAHTIGEWAALGGSITLSAPEVVAQRGAVFDISGGSLDYAGGWIRSTNLIGSDGRRYSVDNAPADMTFTGFAGGFSRTHNIQGRVDERLTETWTSIFDRGRTGLRWEDGYTVGRDAGRLVLSTPTSIFEADIVADTITDKRQTNKRADGVSDGYKLGQNTVARAGTLALGQYNALGLTDAYVTDVKFGNVAAMTVGLDGAATLPAERTNTAWFDASSLNKVGLGGVDVATRGNISVDAPLVLANGAKLTFVASTIDVNAPITAHGGNVTLGNIMRIAPLPGQNEQWVSLSGSDPRVTLASTVDLTGLWSNGLANPNDVSAQAVVDGGKLTVSTTGSIVLTEKAVIDVSSGVAILPSGKLKGGKGGDVSLVTNDYSHLGGTDYFAIDRSAPLILDGVIRGYGFNGGGSLTLNAGQAVVIGGDAVQADTLRIAPDLFSSGFSNYSITSVTGMTVAERATIAPVVPVYQFAASGYAMFEGSELAGAATLWTPPEFIADPVHAKLTQRAGADLTLASLKDFGLQQGASISVDPGRTVTILANGQTTIDGRITAPGGTISVNSIIDLPGQAQVAGGSGTFSLTRSVWIGENALLDVAGRAVVMQDLFGRNYGKVMDGGSILIGGSGVNDQASHAFIVIRPGALLDASGAAATFDLSAGLSSSAPSRPTFIAGNGGTIGLFSNNGIYIDGEVRAAAGGAGASGGTLSLNLVSPAYSPNTPGPNAPDGIGLVPDEIQRLRNITIVQHRQGSGLAADLTPRGADAALQFGTAVISADQVKAGGFDTLSLRTSDLFVFQGDVNLSLGRSLLFSGGMFSSSDAARTSTVTLAAPYVRLDGWVEREMSNGGYYAGLNNIKGPSIYSSDSSLVVTADLVDVSGGLRFGVHGHKGAGFLFYDGGTGPAAPSTSDFDHISAPDIVDAAGFGQVTLQSRGDVRFGTGTLTTRGSLTIKAAQVYPFSGANAVVSAGVVLPLSVFGGIDSPTYDPDAVLTIRGNDGALPQVPASVFGQLSLVAPTIDQGGVVRAPLGIISFNMVEGSADPRWTDWKVILRSGSVTSASANGLAIPFGGTTDGITYQGADGTLLDLASVLADRGRGSYELPVGVAITATSLVGEPGAVLDLSGGGHLAGAGFISGRGGSVDVLKTALINANPAYDYSSSGNKTYAILPGYASAYAPVIASNGAGDPGVGQQVTISGGVPGLPAGTYTLLPSSYALLPGAYRVEVGGTNPALTGMASLANGSYVTGGMLGIANTTIRNALNSQLIVTPGRVIRSYAQYNETSYSDFLVNRAAVFGNVRPRLPEDGKVLWLNLGAATGDDPTLRFAGTALFNATGDGYTGSLVVTSSALTNVIDVTAPGATPVAGHTSISSADLNAFNAGGLFIGGAPTYYNDTGAGPRVAFSGISTVNVLDGAMLRAGQVYVVGSSIDIATNAVIDTRGIGGRVPDSSLGYLFGNVRNETSAIAGPAVLAVANGWLNFLPVVGNGSISIGDNASLLTDGSVVLAAPGNLTIGAVNFGARYLTVTQDQINVGDAAALAAAQAAGVLPSGWTLTQAALDKLLRPSVAAGVPRLEQLTFTAGGMNFFGTVSLDTTGASSGQGLQLVINTPAIYGLGGTGDKATIITDKLVWNGIRTGNGSTVPYGSKAPAPVLPAGAGTGLGQLNIEAGEILFGYDAHVRPTDGATLDRLTLGFSAVNLNASRLITANSDGTLSIGQSRDASGTLVGGDLNLTTPLMTASKGASLSYKSGGAIRVTAPADTPAATATVTGLGGTVSFNGDSILLDTAVALPSGKLTLTATNDIDLGGHATVDLAGRTISFFDATQFSWGGTLVMTSANGHVLQAAGSVVDVSAVNNNAGGVSASATNGAALFNGRVVGGSTGDHRDGSFAVSAQTLGDFAEVNAMLNAGSVFGSRSFNIKQGDLVVDHEVKANNVTIAIDAGSLTVLGTIAASGAKPGTIRLSARDNLTLGGSSVLDAHGTRLQADSYGQAIDADNTAHVELTSTHGTVTLASGATIDMRSPDGVARGRLAINAPRLGSTGDSATGAGAPANATGGDVAVSASGPLNIQGAASIAVYAFASYTNAPADPDDPKGQIIDQAWLDLVNQDSKAFINAAYGGNVAGGALASGLAGKLAGLTAYGNAFHLRPGVEIKSATADGNLTVSGDVDLSSYRYGPNADSTVRGSGEPGSFVLRAGNNLNIKGSINDGFAPLVATPDALEVLASGWLSSSYTVTVSNAMLAAGAVIPSDATINMELTLPADTEITTTPTAANGGLPVDVVLSSPFKPAAGARNVVVTGTIYNPDGSVLYATGAVISTAVTWPAGTRIAQGTYFSRLLINNSFPWVIEAVTLRPNTSLEVFEGYTFAQDTILQLGTVLPQGMGSVSLTAPSNRQIWAISPMLTPGSQSWSMRFVAGADLNSADSRALQSAAALASGGNVTLNDPFQINLRGTGKPGTGVSVVRTGTGDLEILAGGDFDQASPYGIYTAGTAAAGTDSAPFNLGRGTTSDGTVLGAANGAYEATLNPQRMYYTQNGGDVLLMAQGDIKGTLTSNSALVGGWLWRQGGADLGQMAAWGINFGTYTADLWFGSPYIGLSAFSGIGALGGGDVTLNAGRNIGDAGRGIVAAVAGSGWVQAGGQLVQTGGGTLSVTAGGNIGGGGNQFVNVRGEINVGAGAFGSLSSLNFGYNGDDPRALDPLTPYGRTRVAGGSFAIGDGAINVQARGDLAMGTIIDPGRVGGNQLTAAGGEQGVSWFTLWTGRTSLNLFAAGGDLSPLSPDQGSDSSGQVTQYLPSVLRAVAAGGSIFLTPGQSGASFMMPSPNGALELLAKDMIVQQYDAGAAFGPLSTSLASLATPFNPGWELRQFTGFSWSIIASNAWADPTSLPGTNGTKAYSFDESGYNGTAHEGQGGTLFVFGPNTVTDSSALGDVASRVYAVNGDVMALRYGEAFVGTDNAGVQSTYYRAAKPVRVLAGGDIVSLKGVILHNDPTDVSVIAASGNIVYAGLNYIPGQIVYTGLQIAGPGTLEITAGKSIYQGSSAGIDSIGPLVQGDNRPGASVVLQAGVGTGAPGIGQVDWTGFANLYLDPRNLAGKGPLADQPGKVANTYEQELYDWLQQRFGYTGPRDAALGFFRTLPGEQQRIFLRDKVYYPELTASGREYNDPDSSRHNSYLRGREAIAALFPDGRSFGGDITLFTAGAGAGVNYRVNSGYVHTNSGGAIQMLAPAGKVLIGSEGLSPGADAGLITLGRDSDIDIYALGSILLGQSRIMTTFGGNILAWSAEGDINAGRGSKTTVVYTPPKRQYDLYGNVELSPNVPSAGAGIAALSPVPGTPPSNVDLIAPLGTIDAGEAGVRSSGNVNLAALQIINAANIQAQGNTTGVPTVQAPSISAALSTSNATAATQQALPSQGSGNAQPSVIIVEVLGYGGGDVEKDENNRRRGPSGQQTYNTDSAVQIVGAGTMSDEQRRRLIEHGAL
ncbi:filamentous haemagglutinin family protein [Rhodopseudomonas boonkerdii]|uniref:filamentous haemagglutinin family protein n=1 Tax=Rhodopseudomonas boonkerdii TaxID=475937 RepID=UPI001E5AC456|nr:filamentous haemagglutinin family protein [Rhodopseudomonas boonkerdii]